MKQFSLFTFLLLFATFSAQSQMEKKVLFIGNSYTGVNNLPLMVSNMVTSTGDVMVYDANTPGGTTFNYHSTNPLTLQKINSNDWDYVVLQEQSQMPAFPEFYVDENVYPYAESLCNTIRGNNECSVPMFYMTWGRKNGDPSNCSNFPWFCTYEGMDDALRTAYVFMAEENKAEVAPAGAVWRYLRENHPNIELYSSDESHPSIAGSYAAGAAFYTAIYKKDPTLITWNSTLAEETANTIKNAAKTIVYEALADWDFTENPALASFTETIDGNSVTFTNTSSGSDSLYWDFGDGNDSTNENPTHTYSENGAYTASLINYYCAKSDTISTTIIIDFNVSIESAKPEKRFSVYPNPASETVYIKSSEVFSNVHLALTDITGKVARSKFFTSKSEINLNVSDLESGVYILNISTSETQESVKVIITR